MRQLMLNGNAYFIKLNDNFRLNIKSIPDYSLEYDHQLYFPKRFVLGNFKGDDFTKLGPEICLFTVFNNPKILKIYEDELDSGNLEIVIKLPTKNEDLRYVYRFGLEYLAAVNSMNKYLKRLTAL